MFLAHASTRIAALVTTIDVYNTPHANSWFDSERKLSKLHKHKDIYDAIAFSRRYLSTIVFAIGDNVIWTGGPGVAERAYLEMATEVVEFDLQAIPENLTVASVA